MAALLAVGTLLLAGAAAWVALPLGSDEEIPEAAIARFNAACRQEFEVEGQMLAVREDLCTCTVTEAQQQLTTEQFMANDRLLQETGDQVTQEFLDVMNDCQRTLLPQRDK